MKNIIIYFCIICITLLAAIITGENFVVFILGFELVLPVFLLLLLNYFTKKIRVKIKVPATAEKKNQFDVDIILENTGHLPISCLEMIIVCQNAFDRTEIREVVDGVIDGKSRSTVRLGMEAEYAGRIDFRIEKVKVYDYFHIFSRKIACDQSLNQTIIVPNIYDISFSKDFDAAKMLQNGDSYSPDEKGDDIAEIYNIRPFIAGDALHKIHWKLSVKTDELLIKEFSNSIGKAIHIYVDYNKKSEEEWTHDRFDEMAEILASISHQLLQEEEVHQIFWFNSEEKVMHQMMIEKNEDIFETIGELTIIKPYQEVVDYQSMINDNAEYNYKAKAYVLDIWNRMERLNEDATK